MSALTLASAPVPRVVSGRHAASTGRRATRPDAPHPAPGSRALGSRRRRNAWRIVVAAVDPNSDAARKGLQRGDIVLSANYTETGSVAELEQVVRQTQESGREAVLLRVQRRGQPAIYLPIRLR